MTNAAKSILPLTISSSEAFASSARSTFSNCGRLAACRFSSSTMASMSFSSSMGLSSGRHRTAGLCAGAAHGDALLHAADPLAILGAFAADFCAFAACMPVMRRIDQHEMRRRPAHFGARHHQAEMLGLDVLAAGLEAMVHRGAEAGLVAAHAERDAARHVFGLSHPVFSNARPLHGSTSGMLRSFLPSCRL